MHAQKDMKTVVLNDRTTNVTANHTETVGGWQHVTVTDEQTMTVMQKQTVKVHTSRDDAVKANQTVFTGGTKTEQVMGEWKMASDSSIRLACGDAAIQLDSSGHISLICNTFNIYANESGEVSTGSGILDLNKEGAQPGITPLPDLAAMSIEAHFPPEGKGK